MSRRLGGFPWFWGLLSLGPIVWLFVNSLRPSADIFQAPFGFSSTLEWDNYRKAYQLSHFGQFLLNSLKVTAVTTVLTTFGGALLAYPIAVMQFRGRKFVNVLLAAGIAIPLQMLGLPIFFELRQLGLLNGLTGLILVYVATGLPFATFTLTGFFRQVPREIYDSGRLDGCSEWQNFWHLVLPLVRSGLVTTSIFTALSIYNEYFFAFLLLSGNGSEANRTLPLGLANLAITSQFRTDYGQIFAGSALALMPLLVLYVLVSDQMQQGLSEGSVKG